MPKYSSTFNLDPSDIDIIENALRNLLNLHADVNSTCPHQKQTVRSLNEVLGKLHNQKVFYSQVNRTGVPAG